ncbi:MAG: VTT domain-containing protein [Planctomycetales bacterium]
METVPSDDPSPTARRGFFHIAWKLVAALLFLGLIAKYGGSIGHDFVAMEKWISDQGPWGPLVFIITFIVLSSVFVPDTVFAIIAGALFGIFWGTVWMTIAGVVTASLNFYVSRHFLHNRVRAIMEKFPKLSIVEKAATQQGVKLLLLVRLTPISPTAVSYLLGATQTKYRDFLIACLGLIPAFFIEVYFGYVAKHVGIVASRARTHSWTDNAAVFSGFAVCVIVFVYITTVARRALMAAEERT